MAIKFWKSQALAEAELILLLDALETRVLLWHCFHENFLKNVQILSNLEIPPSLHSYGDSRKCWANHVDDTWDWGIAASHGFRENDVF